MKKSFSALLALTFATAVEVSAQTMPQLLYYKFNEGSGTTTQNYAVPGVGTNPAPILGSLTMASSGQFLTGLTGNGGTASTNYVDTGWNTSLSGSWTISFWLDMTGFAGSNLIYYFGDNTASSFRCFTNGVAGANNIMIRTTGVTGWTDLTLTGGASFSGPAKVVTFVYDSAAGQLRGYLDGVPSGTVAAPIGMVLTGTAPFKVGGYGSNDVLPIGTRMDEFRLYNTALTDGEVASSWNVSLNAGPPTGADNPFPADLATNTACNPTLSWNGNGGTSFDVLFDTTNPPGTTVATGLATNSYTPTGLVCGQTYYWQINSSNSQGNASSSVFSFTVTSSAPTQATGTSPSNGAGNLPSILTLAWSSTNASTYNVYLDTVNPPITLATGGSGITASTLNLTGLASSTTYYWRVDATNCCGSTSGTVQSFSTGQILSGNYTIPGDFPSFAAAITALNTFGVGGATTFLVSPGNYSEAVTLTEVTGASAINTITFQKSGAGNVTLNPTVTAAPNTAVYLNGADYFIFDGIDVAATGSGSYYGYYFFGGASNNEIKNCLITTGMAASSSSYRPIYATATAPATNSNNNIHNNEIYNGYYTIYWLGPDPYDSGNTFSNNIIRNFTFYGMYLDDQTNLTISGNDMRDFSGTSTCYGIYATAFDLGTTQTVKNNKFHNIGAGTGLCYPIYFTSSADGKKNIYNNMIYDLNNTGTTYGMWIDDGDDGDEIYHNSILIDNGASTSYGIRLGSSTTTNPTAVKFNNNILVNTNTNTLSSALQIWATTQFATPDNCDYNDYVSSSGNLVKVGTTVNYTDLASWQTGSAFDANSYSSDPHFISATDLHINPSIVSVLDGTGIAIPMVTTDIDGEFRDDPPDLGADEFVSAVVANDVACTSLTYSVLGFTNSPFTISAEVANYGLSSQAPFSVLLTIKNSSNVTVFTNTQNTVGTLVNLATQTVTFAPFTSTVDESYTFTVSTQLGTDSNASNNTQSGAFTTATPLAAGSYTIPGNYATFTDAVNALNIGISGAVTFLVSPGNYPEVVTLGAINGTSAINTVTFQKNGAGDVTINPTPSAAPNSAVYLNGADYVIFDGIDVAPQGTLGYYGYYLGNGADNNEIKNCDITTGMVTSSSSFRGIYQYYITTGFPTNNNNKYHDNVIHNAYYGAYVYGQSANYDTGNEFYDNEVYGCTYYSLYSYYQNASKIYGNDIHDMAGTTSYGLYIFTSNPSSTVEVYNNKVHGLIGSTAAGIYLSSSTTPKKVYNNMIYDFNNTGTSYGIYASSSSVGDEFYHNTVSIDGTGTGTSYGFYVSSITDLVMKNNIVSINKASGTGYCVYKSSGTFASSDYNDFYVNTANPASYIGYYSATAQATLLNWQTATAQDANSISANPNFISDTNVHIATNIPSPADGTGIAIPLVTNDIDGDLRDDPPDLGADEFDYAPTNNDVGISAIGSYSASIVPGNSITLSATAYNYGLLSQTFGVTLTILNSLSSTVFTNTQNVTNLATLTSEIVTFAPYTVGADNYTFTIETTLGTDTNSGNNSMSGAFIGEYFVNLYPFNASMATGWSDANGTGASGEITGITQSSPEHRGFIKFDVSGIPAGSTVNSVTLGLYCSAASAISTSTNPITLLTSDPQTATFSTLFTEAGSTTAILANMLWSPGPAPAWFTTPLTITDPLVLQGLIAQGWAGIGIKRGSTNVYTFDGYNGANPPYLKVYYTPPACPSPQDAVTVTSIQKSGNDVLLNWTASTGADNYKVYWDTVPGGTTNSVDVGDVLNWTHTNGATGSNFFYTVTATCGTVSPVASANKKANNAK